MNIKIRQWKYLQPSNEIQGSIFLCATGLQEGEIKWVDEDTKKDNRQHEPFFLLRHSSRCQVVLSMRVIGEWLFWDCEDRENKNSYNGEVPASFITKDVKLHYCYYEKQWKLKKACVALWEWNLHLKGRLTCWIFIDIFLLHFHTLKHLSNKSFINCPGGSPFFDAWIIWVLKAIL